MPFEWTEGSASKATRSLYGGIAVAGVVLVALVFGVSLACASLQEETANAVGSVVTPVVQAPESPMPIPSPAPVDTQPLEAPTEQQAPVKAPTSPQVPVEVPVEVTPATSPSRVASTPSGGATAVSSPDVSSSFAGGATGAAKAGGGAIPPTKTAQRVPASVRNGVDASSNSPGGSGARPVKAVPLPRWLARVWPAIALLRTVKVLAVLLARWEGGTPARAFDDVQMASRLGGIAGHSEVLGISKQSVSPHDGLGSHAAIPVPADGGMSLLLTMITSLLTVIGLIALGRLLVGEEFFSLLR